MAIHRPACVGIDDRKTKLRSTRYRWRTVKIVVTAPNETSIDQYFNGQAAHAMLTRPERCVTDHNMSSDIEKLAKAITEWGTPPNRKHELKAKIDALRPALTQKLKEGWSIASLAKGLTDAGLAVSPFTLRKHLGGAVRKRERR